MKRDIKEYSDLKNYDEKETVIAIKEVKDERCR